MLLICHPAKEAGMQKIHKVEEFGDSALHTVRVKWAGKQAKN